MLFVWYPKCSTCQRAKAWLDAHGIAYEARSIVERPPTVAELKRWLSVSGLPLKRFFNTSGLVYQSMDLKNRLPGMAQEEQLALLASNGMLVKRPILADENLVLVGFRSAEWQDALQK